MSVSTTTPSTPVTYTEPTQSALWSVWRQIRKPVSTIAWYAVMIAVSLVVLIPIILVVFGSFKTVNEFFSTPYGLPKAWDFFNYKKAWNTADLQHAALNSLISTFFGVLFSTILACLASYGLARFAFRGNGWIRLAFIGGLVVPVQLIIIPIFIIMRQTGLLGSIWSLVLVYSVLGIPLGVLVMVGFFRALPRDLEEAARIDGASHFQIFWKIMLPLTRPALAAVIILNGVWMWNDFFLGLILLTREDAYTLPVAIMAFRGSYSTEWGLIFASVIISVLPVLIGYVLLSRQFIAGLTAGSVKG
jgi:raffinose/stachyose/melibiose transport system permease protein